MSQELPFTCSKCGASHDALATQPAYDAPDRFFAVPEPQRAARTVLGTDQCTIDDREFFIRGCVFVPLDFHDEPFAWGVWVSLTRANYEYVGETWYSEGKEGMPPIASRLANELPLHLYPSTFNLKSRLTLLPVGQRPSIRIEDLNHPLAKEQTRGISAQRLVVIQEWSLHMPQIAPPPLTRAGSEVN